MSKKNKFEECEHEFDDPRLTPRIKELVDSRVMSINQWPSHDKIASMEVALQPNENFHKDKVKGRSFGLDGMLVGTYDENLMLNTMTHEVKFSDGQIR